jgi:uncharacterized protein YndB with AHSA1/START domain
MTSNWSEFKLRVNINSPIETVYRHWATAAGLESWFLRKAVFTTTDGQQRDGQSFLQPGDQYEWVWHGYPDSVNEKGKILQANARNVFGFTFSLGCPVTITITSECNETIVQLVESNLPADESTLFKHYVGDSRGWIFYLANLKSVLEGGLDLRNRKIELQNVITS